MPLRLVQGYTGALDFDLLAGGLHDPAVSSGDGVELILRTRTGRRIATSSQAFLETTTSSGGTLVFARYLPEADDLRADESPYQARFKLTRMTRDVYYPSGESDPWTIYA